MSTTTFTKTIGGEVVASQVEPALTPPAFEHETVLVRKPKLSGP